MKILFKCIVGIGRDKGVISNVVSYSCRIFFLDFKSKLWYRESSDSVSLNIVLSSQQVEE